MNRLFFTLALFLGFISQSFSRDFGDKSLEPEAQAKLDALIEKLADPSIKRREKTIGEILEFGDGAIETLQKAQFHPDFTVAECAKYCHSMLAPGMVRSSDPPKVKTLLNRYESLIPLQKMNLILILCQLPSEESLIPLMRIVMHEKNPSVARFSALAVFWRLPYTQPLPQIPLPVPEAKNFPDPVEWSIRNEMNLKNRQKMIEEIRKYLASESVFTEGKHFLELLIQLEMEARNENADASRFEETFQTLYERMAPEDPADLTLLHDFLYFSADVLAQNGHENEASDFFLNETTTGLTSFGKANFQENKDLRTIALTGRIILIHRLVQRGHWAFVPQEIALLYKDISPHEKVDYIRDFSSSLSMIGEFRLAWDYTQNVRRLIFLDLQNKISKEKGDKVSAMLQQQLSQYQALDACKKKDYTKAKEVLIKCLETIETPNVDMLILARKIAVFTNDSEWLNSLDKQIDKMLDKTEKIILDDSLDPPSPTQLNTFAWLAANTDRRLDDALKYAEEAVRSSSDSPGIQDTLAMVHFARGDYEKAFEIQTKAVEESFMEMELWVNLERIRVYRDEKKSEKVESTP